MSLTGKTYSTDLDTPPAWLDGVPHETVGDDVETMTVDGVEYVVLCTDREFGRGYRMARYFALLAGPGEQAIICLDKGLHGFLTEVTRCAPADAERAAEAALEAYCFPGDDR